jgi:hypothetical protein
MPDIRINILVSAFGGKSSSGTVTVTNAMQMRHHWIHQESAGLALRKNYKHCTKKVDFRKSTHLTAILLKCLNTML